MSDQAPLPIFDGPVLVAGPVFVCFELGGKPGHKGRHRSRIVIPKDAFLAKSVSRRIFIHNYPDPDTAAYEATLKQAAVLFMRGRPPTELPVALVVHSFREIPKSWPKRDQAAALAGAIMPTSKPDWDNHGKVTDSLNGIIWKDDSQVVDGRSIKLYSDRPALRIEVREMIPR